MSTQNTERVSINVTAPEDHHLFVSVPDVEPLATAAQVEALAKRLDEILRRLDNIDSGLRMLTDVAIERSERRRRIEEIFDQKC